MDTSTHANIKVTKDECALHIPRLIKTGEPLPKPVDYVYTGTPLHHFLLDEYYPYAQSVQDILPRRGTPSGT